LGAKSIAQIRVGWTMSELINCNQSGAASEYILTTFSGTADECRNDH
jgi:hypothetical protein